MRCPRGPLPAELIPKIVHFGWNRRRNCSFQDKSLSYWIVECDHRFKPIRIDSCRQGCIDQLCQEMFDFNRTPAGGLIFDATNFLVFIHSS